MAQDFITFYFVFCQGLSIKEMDTIMDVVPKKMKVGSFQSMDIDLDIYKGLNRMGYKVATPVQRKALPIALAGMDLVCMARTGSGKTCVFLLPMLQKLKSHDPKSGVRAIILSPTRLLFFLFIVIINS